MGLHAIHDPEEEGFLTLTGNESLETTFPDDFKDIEVEKVLDKKVLFFIQVYAFKVKDTPRLRELLRINNMEIQEKEAAKTGISIGGGLKLAIKKTVDTKFKWMGNEKVELQETNTSSANILSHQMQHQEQTQFLKRIPKTTQAPNVWSFVTMGWLTPLLSLGYRRPLEFEDLPLPKPKDRADYLAIVLKPYYQRLNSYLLAKREKAPGSAKLQPPTPFPELWDALGRFWVAAAFMDALNLGIELLDPFMLQGILYYLESGSTLMFITSPIVLCVLLFLSAMLRTVLGQMAAQTIRNCKFNAQSALTGAVFQKSLKLSNASAKKFSSGRVIQMIDTDVESVVNMLSVSHMLFVTPAQLIAIIACLYLLVGKSVYGVAIAFGIILVIAPFFVISLGVFQTHLSTAGDSRTRMIRELFLAIKTVKLQGAETLFYKRVDGFRRTQLRALVGYSVSIMLFFGIILIIPVATPVATFIVYADTVGDLSPAIIFPALTFLNLIFQPLQSLANNVSGVINGRVSWLRIKEFLACEEAELNFKPAEDATDDDVVVVQEATFGWTRDKEALFKNINLRLKKGKLYIVVGSVGSGKSSLIAALLGEMERREGTVSLFGTVAYCQQQPWLVSDTVKNNVLFGHKEDSARLSRALRVCGLETDLTQFEKGIATEVGEKGIALSGGQKARLALARALYDDADIYLLDDTLAALDAHVSKQTFNDCIRASLANKTRLLVTHNLDVLAAADSIIVMKEGSIIEQGSLEELTAVDGELRRLMKEREVAQTEANQKKNAATNDAIVGEVSRENATGTDVVAEEERRRGAVPGSVYITYFKNGVGLWYLFIVFLTAVFMCSVGFISVVWLVWWSNDVYDIELFQYIWIYTGLSLGNFAAVDKEHSPKSHACASSSPNVLPIGRILNRMNRDVSESDRAVWQFYFNTTLQISNTIIAMAIFIYSTYYVIAVYAVLSIGYYFTLQFYRANNRELKRLVAIYKSPLNAHISESVGGTATLKAFQAGGRAIQRQRQLIDISITPFFIMENLAIWLNLRVRTIIAPIVLMLSLYAVLSNSANAAVMGLAISYASGIAELFAALVRMMSNLEAGMVSVERLEHYASDLPAEAAAEIFGDPKIDEWPSKGEIEVQKLEVKYASREEAVIKDLNLKIDAGQKIGIVGRTGSGKSTFLTALFRLVEPSAGKIFIDGIDIGSLGLHTLRTRIQIIPQDPCLFSGTIRSNIDNEGRFTDSSVWEALELVGLKEYVSSLSSKLSSRVTENGDNLSVGQRQLIILARAVIQNPRILVLDEASSALDAEADERIQQVIRTSFKNGTVISIAHRLNTVADFDKIAVLDAGRLVEFDTPLALLKKKDGVFRGLVDATGVQNAILIAEVAEKHGLQ
ncbi:hypothetical protein HK100_000397 [Physocladia obscura]|uniref:Uncharacterized protein n=1 Tax=Physocladia obscura TaxID=109957 RepID=A0AAD5T090_9FUNG|nr:hypothetical protein HK100_000397 [Physocladia obscura]